MKTNNWYLVKDHLSGKEKQVSERLWQIMKGKLHNDRPRYELLKEPSEVVVAEKKSKSKPEKKVVEPVADNPTNQEIAKKLDEVKSLMDLDEFCKWLGKESQNWTKEIEAKETEIKLAIKEGGLE